MRILVADDDPGIGDMLREMLEEAGYDVEIQADGHALQQMREPFPDLLLLDIRLSGTDGQSIAALSKARKRHTLFPSSSSQPIKYAPDRQGRRSR